MAEKLLSIIVPIYNEENIVAGSLPIIFNLNINKEVLIINDGSTDNTRTILQELKKKYDFKLIDQASNQGKGAAIKRGLEEIKGDYFIICDADLEYQALDIVYLLTQMLSTKDTRTVIYGSRFLARPTISFHYLINKFLTTLTNLLFGSRLTDMETCFKLIPVTALKTIKLTGRRFEIEPEITAQLLKAGYNIKEFPIHYVRRGYKEGKKIKARDGLLAIKTLISEKLFN
ncbi:MAG: glycosyltransferase family 2 protein [Patescibacteria group bacterium]|jgi:glycosyltransferase involved in cell wall biosynthesis